MDVVILWIDENLNLVKMQEFSLSGRLLRTLYLTRHQRYHNPQTKTNVTLPSEVRIFDELVKDRVSVLSFKAVDLSPIPEHTFTKAWLESKSR